MANAKPVSATPEGEQELAPATVIVTEPVKAEVKKAAPKATKAELDETIATIPEGKSYQVIGNAVRIDS